ncbi:hypothetical protein KI387_022336, partial [Taxus chinensis]
AYNSKDFYMNEFKRNILIVAFCGSQKSTDFVTETDFDECEINNANQYFKSIKDSNVEDPKTAVIQKSFLDQFLYMLQRSNLTEKVLQAQNKKKTVIFTGHSFGGAIASLWTLWLLEKRHEKYPLCITFGCPLFGDKIFAKAIEHAQWSPYFCHIVSSHDIVPRICFSSFKSAPISKALEKLLPYWYKSMQNRAENQQPVQDGSHPLSKDVSLSFIKQVISDASQVVTYETRTLVVGPANLVGGLTACYSKIVKSDKSSTDEVRMALQLEAMGIGIQPIRQVQGTLYGYKMYLVPVQHRNVPRNDQGTAREVQVLRCFLLSNPALSDRSMKQHHLPQPHQGPVILNIPPRNAQAWLGLKAAEDDKNNLTKNMDQQITKLDEMQNYMAELEWYKTSCEEGGFPGYYDCFKTHKTEKDMNANKNRYKLATFCDDITELVEREELPKDLQTQEKWVNVGTEYRLLVEPLDIAHYYRLGKHED